MAWLTGGLVENGWLTGTMDVPDSDKKIYIQSPNLVVDVYGNPVTHTYQYWFITQSDIDISNYNGNPITVAAQGTNLEIVDGEGEVLLTASGGVVTGQTYRLVAFDSDESHYFRFSGIAVEV